MNKKTALLLAAARYSHMGFLLLALSVGGFFLGWWIDGLLWKFPAFAILLFLTGFGLGFYHFILKLEEDKQRKDAAKKQETPED